MPYEVRGNEFFCLVADDPFRGRLRRLQCLVPAPGRCRLLSKGNPDPHETFVRRDTHRESISAPLELRHDECKLSPLLLMVGSSTAHPCGARGRRSFAGKSEYALIIRIAMDLVNRAGDMPNVVGDHLGDRRETVLSCRGGVR